MTPEIEAYIRLHYPTKGPKAIATELDVKRGTVYWWARQLGLKVNPKARLHLYRRGPRPKLATQCRVNPEQFLSVSAPDVAYLLGFLWADGCVRPVGASGWVALNNRSDDMADIREVLKRTGSWCFYSYPTRKRAKHPQTMVRTSGAELYRFLDAHDYRSKSASPDKILSHIPEHLHHYWWRGYFDGDGNLYIGKHCHQISFASTYEQDWSFAMDLCTQLNIRFTVTQSVSTKRYKSSTFRVCGIENCKTLGAYLYRGYDTDGIGLKRKHIKYVELSAMHAKPTVSSYAGVTLWHKSNRWGSAIFPNKVNGLTKPIRLGYFDTAEEANRIRLDYIAKHNIPQYERKQHKVYDQSPKPHG